MQQELVALRAMGVAVEASQIQALVPKFEGENAAPYYLAAIEARRLVWLSKPESEAMSEVGGPRKSVEDELLAARAIRKMEIVLVPLERAAELKGCDFQRQWELGFDLLLPEYSGMKDLASLLSARSRIAALRGEVGVAIRDIERMHAVADHVAADPTEIAFLVSSAMRERATETSRTVAEILKDDPTALEKLLALNKSAVRPLEYALAGVVPGMMDLVDRVGDLKVRELRMQGRSQEITSFDLLWQQPTVRLGAQRKLLVSYRRAMEAVRQRRDIVELNSRLGDVDRLAQIDDSPSGQVASYVRSMYTGLTNGAMRMEATRRLEQVGLRLMIERTKGRSFPEKLPDWGEVTMDPFTNQPLNYRKTEGGFVVFSAGRFGGVEPPRGRRDEPKPPYGDDIAWEFPAKVKKFPPYIGTPAELPAPGTP